MLWRTSILAGLVLSTQGLLTEDPRNCLSATGTVDCTVTCDGFAACNAFVLQLNPANRGRLKVICRNGGPACNSMDIKQEGAVGEYYVCCEGTTNTVANCNAVQLEGTSIFYECRDNGCNSVDTNQGGIRGTTACDMDFNSGSDTDPGTDPGADPDAPIIGQDTTGENEIPAGGDDDDGMWWLWLLLLPLLLLCCLWWLWPLLCGGSDKEGVQAPLQQSLIPAQDVSAVEQKPFFIDAQGQKQWNQVEASNYIWANGGGGAAPLKTQWGQLGSTPMAPKAKIVERVDEDGNIDVVVKPGPAPDSPAVPVSDPSCFTRCCTSLTNLRRSCNMWVASVFVGGGKD